MKPTLVVNPDDDDVFATYARVLVEDGAATIEEFERRLRTMYPGAAAHRRELVGEAVLIWYVYRDGYWVDSQRVIDASGAREHDA